MTRTESTVKHMAVRMAQERDLRDAAAGRGSGESMSSRDGMEYECGGGNSGRGVRLGRGVGYDEQCVMSRK